MKIVLTIFITFALAASVASQNNMQNKHDFALLFGLNQPLLLNGFNAEINYFTPKFVFDYSHGVSLELFNTLTPDAVPKPHIACHLSYFIGL